MEKNAAQVPCSLPDTELRESVPQQLVTSALQSEGIKEVFKLPNTKFKLLQQLLTRAISAFKQMNRHKGIDLGDKLWALVKCYNNRKEGAPPAQRGPGRLYLGDHDHDRRDALL